MKQIKSINEPDSRILLKEIEQTEGSIILAGTRGTGKSYTINKLFENNDSDCLIVNGTIRYDESLPYVDRNIYELYYISLMIKKMIIYIKQHFGNDHSQKFMMYENYIDHILLRVNTMYITGIYDKAKTLVGDEIYESPELLLERFLSVMVSNLDFKKIFLVIDDFDKTGGSSSAYQKLMYNKIKNYIPLVMTFSDDKVVTDDSKLQEFSKKNIILKMEYSKDVNVVAEILDIEIIKNYSLNNNLPFFNSRQLLGDETIALIIEKTNANLFDMRVAIRYLYAHINQLSQDEYSKFILDFIDQEINKSPILTGRIIPKRTLFIKS